MAEKTESYNLTPTQATWLGERVTDLLDDTEDWQLPDDEFQDAIQSWVDILKGLKQDEMVKQVINDYSDICELT